MPIEGFLESSDTLQVRGWVYDTALPDRHIDVEILCADQQIGLVRADVYRRDLEAAAIGQGDHAFILNCEPPIRLDKLSLITARAIIPEQPPILLEKLSTAAVPSTGVDRPPDVIYPGISQDETHRPVFILGSARSGTSAVAQGLTAATCYQGQEEGHFLEVLAPLFVHLHTYYDAKSDEVLRNTMIARVPERFMKDALRNAAIVAARQLFPRGYWIEKTPNANMIHLAPRFLEIWPNARFIFMKRRAIENIASRLRKFPYDFAHNCREWANAMEAWLHVRDQLKGTAVEIDQKFLAQEPQAATLQIAKLLEISETEKKRLAQILSSARPQRTSLEFLQANSLSDWSLDRSDLEVFTRICGPLMEKYGYNYSDKYYRADAKQNGCILI